MTQRRKPQHYTREVNGKTIHVNRDVSYSQKTTSTISNRTSVTRTNEEPKKLGFSTSLSNSTQAFLLSGISVGVLCSIPAVLGFTAVLPLAVILGVAQGSMSAYKSFKKDKTYNHAIDCGFSHKEAVEISDKNVDHETITEEGLKKYRKETIELKNSSSPQEVQNEDIADGVLNDVGFDKNFDKSVQSIPSLNRKTIHDFTKLPSGGANKIIQ